MNGERRAGLRAHVHQFEVGAIFFPNFLQRLPDLFEPELCRFEFFTVFCGGIPAGEEDSLRHSRANRCEDVHHLLAQGAALFQLHQSVFSEPRGKLFQVGDSSGNADVVVATVRRCLPHAGRKLDEELGFAERWLARLQPRHEVIERGQSRLGIRFERRQVFRDRWVDV